MSDVSPEQEKGMISRFWAWISQSQTLQKILIALLVLAFGAFVGVLLSECIAMYISKLLGLSFQKNETLKFLGISMGGILIALQALMSYKRAKAMEETANAQVKATEEQAKANENTERGQRQERLKNAIEHLGHDKDSVRLGGAYELFHLAKDTLEEDPKEKLSQTVLDILCAHIRQTTGESKYRETHKSKPSGEIQSLLTLLFVQEHEVFKGCHINLQESWLQGASLSRAYLVKATLSEARLQGTRLDEARLQGAFLFKAQLQGAILFKAQLQGANLDKTQLQGAFLFETQLQGAILFETQLQGVVSSLYGLSFMSFEDLIRGQIGKETDLSTVIFAGGLSQESMESLVKDLPDEAANKLREKLTPHIDQLASNQLPENSYAITSSYTEEEAERWIAEYKKAVPEIPEDDS